MMLLSSASYRVHIESKVPDNIGPDTMNLEA
jgi:hypothetical protein